MALSQGFSIQPPVAPENKVRTDLPNLLIIDDEEEVLPLCMECGKVKSTDSSWEDVLDFLKKNRLFLSQGYCPEYAKKVTKRLKESIRS